MLKKLPIGLCSFEEIISDNYYFVDKSLLIKEILDNGAKVTLIPRPRRFGKTLNLSMLKVFFEKTSISQGQGPIMKKTNGGLFKNLNISKYPEYLEHQEKYPVIFLTFKDAKVDNWDLCYEKIKKIISSEFKRHKYLLENNFLSEKENRDFQEIINETASQAVYENSIKDLSVYLHKFYNKAPIILIDEYDVPIQAGFLNNFYKEVINFTRNLLCACLKDNSNISFGVLTGILRVAKESIFSGLNNLKVCSLINDSFADKFGLLEKEVEELFNYYKFTNNLEEIRSWYNGYSVGKKITVYNPWSIINLISNKLEIQPYWINTSDNLIIKNLIEQGSQDLKIDIEQLLVGQEVEKYISENIIFDDVFSKKDTVWSFLLFSGYLTFSKVYIKDGLLTANLKIPNTEVKSFYKTVILEWLKNNISFDLYLLMLKNLTTGDVNTFKKLFYDFTKKSFSYFDVSGQEPEKFYHAFVLGMLVSLSEHYQIKSNRESGYGRYDLMVIPKNIDKLGIIIEFKKVDEYENETLEIAVDNALRQIEEKNYQVELEGMGIKNILKLGIAFEGKKVLIKN